MKPMNPLKQHRLRKTKRMIKIVKALYATYFQVNTAPPFDVGWYRCLFLYARLFLFVVEMRVLPSGGCLDQAATAFSHSAKVVESPNPNRKFSKRVPSGSNISTVFKDVAPAKAAPPSGRARSKSPTFDPFDSSRPDHCDNILKRGVRITKVQEKQMEDARRRQDQPRFFRKAVDAKASRRSISPNVDPIVSVYGLPLSGGKGQVDGRRVNQESATPAGPPPAKDYSQMSRFRCSPARTEVCVTRAETLTDTAPAKKEQRFACSPSRRHTSLVGVLSPEPRCAPPPQYKLTTPWHTD